MGTLWWRLRLRTEAQAAGIDIGNTTGWAYSPPERLRLPHTGTDDAQRVSLSGLMAWRGSMPAKKVSQKKGGGPSLQDLANKIAALERAKASKSKRDGAVASSAAATSKRTRASARKQELWALYV
ncbi:UNVERIFIED_CONTAM: hypothetical protein K2H54_056824 [Gekko kuhli]